jgi:hypothetical protein
MPCHKAKSKAEHKRWRETIGVNQKRTMSPERRQQVKEFFQTYEKSPEHREKIREGLKRAWARKSPEERQAIAAKSAQRQLGRKHGPMSEDRRRKIGDAQRRAWASGRRGRSTPLDDV